MAMTVGASIEITVNGAIRNFPVRASHAVHEMLSTIPLSIPLSIKGLGVLGIKSVIIRPIADGDDYPFEESRQFLIFRCYPLSPLEKLAIGLLNCDLCGDEGCEACDEENPWIMD